MRSGSDLIDLPSLCITAASSSGLETDRSVVELPVFDLLLSSYRDRVLNKIEQIVQADDLQNTLPLAV